MQFRLVPGRRAGLLALVALLGAFVLAVAIPDPTAAQQSAKKLTTQEIASHVLNRLAFGPRPGQVAEVAKMGWKKWFEEQLYPEKIEFAALDKRLKERSPSIFYSIDKFQEYAKEDKKTQKVDKVNLLNDLREAVLLRAVFSRAQFQEVMLEFWRNHFNVYFDKVPFLATHYEENVLRKHAFGKFEDLLMAVAKHPCMLVYLDNYVSLRRAVNENYARELMELHTLGVDNYYTQKDVEAVARTLTGWTCGFKTGKYSFFFNESAHDPKPVKILDLELDGSGGLEDGEKLIKYLATHPGTARFISTKLCRYLVNDFPSSDLIETATQVFQKTGGDLREVYRAIVYSPDFLDPKNYRAKFKTPFEYTISVLRITRAAIDSSDSLFKELRLMGQPIYEYEEPTGYSDQREAWLDPGIMVYRWNFAIALVTGQLKGVRIGTGFVEDVMKTPPAGRPKKVMEICLPGMTDTKALALASQTSDPRAMVAWALGSATFQQQ